MKKTIVLFIIILINISCSSISKSIDRKVYKIEKTIDNSPYFSQNLCWNCSPEIDALIYFTKIENQIKKINFEIDSNNNCNEYSKKITIYLESNVPILITEITTGTCEHEISGVNRKTNKFESSKQESKIFSNVKVYINDWQKFKITVIGGNEFDYNLRTKDKYGKIIGEILKQEKID